MNLISLSVIIQSIKSNNKIVSDKALSNHLDVLYPTNRVERFGLSRRPKTNDCCRSNRCTGVIQLFSHQVMAWNFYCKFSTFARYLSCTVSWQEALPSGRRRELDNASRKCNRFFITLPDVKEYIGVGNRLIRFSYKTSEIKFSCNFSQILLSVRCCEIKNQIIIFSYSIQKVQFHITAKLYKIFQYNFFNSSEYKYQLYAQSFSS